MQDVHDGSSGLQLCGVTVEKVQGNTAMQCSQHDGDISQHQNITVKLFLIMCYSNIKDKMALFFELVISLFLSLPHTVQKLGTCLNKGVQYILVDSHLNLGGGIWCSQF